jgi:hypothetical protein
MNNVQICDCNKIGRNVWRMCLWSSMKAWAVGQIFWIFRVVFLTEIYGTIPVCSHIDPQWSQVHVSPIRTSLVTLYERVAECC